MCETDEHREATVEERIICEVEEEDKDASRSSLLSYDDGNTFSRRGRRLRTHLSVAAVAAHTVVPRRQHMSPSRRRRRQPATVHILGAAVSTSQDLQLNAFPCCDPRLFCSSTPTGHFAGLRPCRQWGCSFLYPLSFVCDRRVIKRINILCK